MAGVSSADLLAYAKRYLGVPYQMGAAGPDRFDCSGYTQYVFHHFGINLPHHAADQAKLGTPVDKSAVRAGDLVFSDWGDGANSHVGIATGDGRIIDAPHTGAVVRYDNLSSGYLSHVTAVRRMAGVGAASAGATLTGGGDGNGLDPGGLATIPIPGGSTTTGLLDSLVQPFKDIASFALSAKSVADGLFKLWAPTNIVRGVAGLMGIVFILLGIWVLSREVR